jgi:hypothetical protein
MGSGSKRKATDNVRIKFRTSGGGGGSNVDNSETTDITCPILIKVKIPKKDWKEDSVVEVKKQGDVWFLSIGLLKISDIAESRQRQFGHCFEQGFLYSGQIKKDEKGDFYVELRRRPA